MNLYAGGSGLAISSYPKKPGLSKSVLLSAGPIFFVDGIMQIADTQDVIN